MRSERRKCGTALIYEMEEIRDRNKKEAENPIQKTPDEVDLLKLIKGQEEKSNQNTSLES